MDDETVLVDGETFRVQQRRGEPWVHDFTWESGPNPGYGFTSASSDRSAMTETTAVEAIRDFLAQIDPRTGFVGD